MAECRHPERKYHARGMCRPCYETWHVAHNPERKAKVYAARTAWRKKNYFRDLRSIWAARVRKNFGISIEQYETMLREQSGVCGLCGLPENVRRRLAVDHDHKTGAVRGLLCFRCNTKLDWALAHFDLIAEWRHRDIKRETRAA